MAELQVNPPVTWLPFSGRTTDKHRLFGAEQRASPPNLNHSFDTEGMGFQPPPHSPQIPASHVRELHSIKYSPPPYLSADSSDSCTRTSLFRTGGSSGGPDPHAIHLHVVPPVNRAPPREHGDALVLWHRGDCTAGRASLPRNLHGGGTRIGGCTANLAVDRCQAPHPCCSPVCSAIHIIFIAIGSAVYLAFNTISIELLSLAWKAFVSGSR